MSRKYKFRDQDKLYFISYALVYWIDLFIRDEYRTILLDSWKYCMKEKGLDIYGWVIMTSHVHMIIGSHGDKMEKIMQVMKKHTSDKLKLAIKDHPSESRREWMLDIMTKAGAANSNNVAFQLWQQNNHPIELIDSKMAHQKLEYIHYNPVVAGFVDRPEDYLYSSARDYVGRKGLLDIILLDPLIH